MPNEILFKQPQAGRATEDIALQMEAAIISKKILPGQRIPSERELQIHFGTGRGVIREALRILKQKGLLEVKKGRNGAFVKQAEVKDISESLSLFLKQKDISAEQMIEFRENIDQMIGKTAIVRADEQERNELLQKALELKNLVSQPGTPIGGIGEYDKRLNILLARMSKNPIFEWIMEALQFGFSSYDYALYETEPYRTYTIDNWVQTAREIKNKELVKALSCISYHYHLLRQCIEQKRQQHHSEN